MRYNFLISKKNNCYYAKGIDNKFYTQANTEAELLKKIEKGFYRYLELNFNFYNIDTHPSIDIKENDLYVYHMIIPSGFAFGLIMKEMGKKYSGGKEKLAKAFGFDNIWGYEDMYENTVLPSMMMLDKVRVVLPNFPFHWMFD